MPGDKPNNEKNKYVPQHITVNMQGQSGIKVGENLSSRQQITVLNEQGQKITGFFTANESVNTKHSFVSRNDSSFKTKNLEPYLPLYNFLLNKNEDMENTIQEMFGVLGIERCNSVEEAEEISFSKCEEATRNKFFNWLKMAGAPADLIDNNIDNPAFLRYMDSFIQNAEKSSVLTRIHLQVHYQSQNSNVNRRNNAMSDFAELLEEPDLFAKSSNMTIVNGDKQINGTFMLNAKGQSFESWRPELEPFDEDREIIVSPEAMKQLSSIQVMDFLCGNVDRHPGNLFYQMDFSDKDYIKIAGVQGIDNDASFGTVEFKTGDLNLFMSKLNDIKVIDDKLAENILKITPEQIEEKIRLAGLSKEELAAAQERLSALKESIQSGKIERISDPKKWEEYTDVSTKKADRPAHHIENLRTSLSAGGVVIGNIYDNVMDKIEAYNEQRQYYKSFSEKEYQRVYGKAPAGSGKKVPIGFASNIDDSFSVKNQIERLEELNAAFIKTDVNNNSPEFQKMYDKFKDVMNVMKDVSKGKFLTDNQKNFLVENLNGLKQLTDDYISKKNPHFGRGKERLHIAKNLAALIGPMKDGIRNDAAEADMNSASREFADVKKLVDFNEKYKNILNPYKESRSAYKENMKSYKDALASKNAEEIKKTSEALRASEKAVLECKQKIADSKKEFVEDFHAVIDIYKNYPKNHDMQRVCDQLIVGSGTINGYIKAASEGLPKKATGKQVFESIGLTEDDLRKEFEIEKNAKPLTDAYNKKHAAAENQIKANKENAKSGIKNEGNDKPMQMGPA